MSPYTHTQTHTHKGDGGGVGGGTGGGGAAAGGAAKEEYTTNQCKANEETHAASFKAQGVQVLVGLFCLHGRSLLPL